MENPPEQPNQSDDSTPEKLKIARVLDQSGGGFTLEYENTLGKKNTMRLDASSYEGAVREARSYLGINAEGSDADGIEWHVKSVENKSVQAPGNSRLV